MARTHAKLLCSIWTDEDFATLTPLAQRMFLLLISQPKLSMCGVIDYVPARWARYAPGMTVDDVEDCISELEARRYVLVDRDQAELLVRSFVKNDGLCARWQMVSAMWSAWEAVSSPRLRAALIAELPEEAWTADKAVPPANAIASRLAMRTAIESDPEHLHLQTAPSPARLAGIDAARRALA